MSRCAWPTSAVVPATLFPFYGALSLNESSRSCVASPPYHSSAFDFYICCYQHMLGFPFLTSTSGVLRQELVPKLLGFPSGIRLADDGSVLFQPVTAKGLIAQTFTLNTLSLPTPIPDALAALTPRDATCLSEDVPMPALLRMGAHANTQVCVHCISPPMWSATAPPSLSCNLRSPLCCS